MIYKLAKANHGVNSLSSWMPGLAEASICFMTSALDLASIMERRRKFLAALVEHEKRVEQRGANKRVAERLDMDPSHLSQILTGHRKCGEDVALKIAAKLGVSVETINQFGVDYSDLSIGQIPPGVIPLSGPSEAEIDRSLLRLPPSVLLPGAPRTPIQEMLGSFEGKKEVVSERAVDTWHPEDALPAGYTTINAVEARHADLGGGSRYALVDYPDEKPRVYSTEFFSRHKLDPRNLRAYRVSGDSMKPMLWDGCWVVIDTSKTVIVDERIYALAVGDELLVKQLVRGVGNKIVVNSFNPSHPTQVVDPEVLPVQIFGQVVEYSCVLV